MSAYIYDGLRTPFGARIALTATRQLEQVEGRYALISLCIGVGQGIAAVLERVTD